jgi:iron complex outermembrane recepter protein
MKKGLFILLMQWTTMLAWGQHELTGIVYGKGEPLAGANVVIQNTWYGQSTDLHGKFRFTNLPPGKYRLTISFIGYEKTTVPVNLDRNTELEVTLIPSVIFTDEILVSGTRAKDKTPMAYTNISEEEIAERNLGQDIPYLLSLTPSFVATSDAGTGIGYTHFRIRGTDLNRINVTVNGIPLNDAESHGTWFVDQPDLASSLENVQIQRGVGTSSNGASAFGASINLQTNTVQKEAYTRYTTTAGSFNTFKHTVAAGTGLINQAFTFDARLSKVTSDGFVDRAFSDLKSFFLSAGYYTENTVLKTHIFSGIEETYQAWWGVPSVRLNNDREGMQRYQDHWLYTPKQTEEMIRSDSRTYNYYTYKNQIDHYQQDHYQLHFLHRFNDRLNMNAALHYTYGKGYYENFKEDEAYADYRMPSPVVGSDTLETTDLVTRKWLDNDFYGIVFSLNYTKGKSDLTLGGGWNNYDGRHFGNVIWAEQYGKARIDHEWYRGTGVKKDGNLYSKYHYQVTPTLHFFTDVQFRHIHYQITGIDDDLRDISQIHVFRFFNPKCGLLYKPFPSHESYISWARSNREPNRSNYTDAKPGSEPPVHETLNDLEAGYTYRSNRLSAGANFYFMMYKNQLILTGEINDVGNPIMTNTEKSYRTGCELSLGLKIKHNLQWDLNVTLSRNKILDFTEYVDNWDTGGQEAFYLETTDLAFSPQTTANSNLTWRPGKNLNLHISSAWVGKQYIDNSASDDRKLNPWFVHTLKMDYTLKTNFFENIKLHLLVNNLFNATYESNAWVYSYILGGERYKMDGYFPQAGIHYMAGLEISF